MESTDEKPETVASSAEVDVTLIDWYLGLSVTERLRAASKSAATLERLRRAASSDR
jgi:hypothetical protein